MLMDSEIWADIEGDVNEWARRSGNMDIYDYIEDKHENGSWGRNDADSDKNSDECEWTCVPACDEDNTESCSYVRICYKDCVTDGNGCILFQEDGTWEECKTMLMDYVTWANITGELQKWAIWSGIIRDSKIDSDECFANEFGCNGECDLTWECKDFYECEGGNKN